MTHCTSASSRSTASRVRDANRDPLISTAWTVLDEAQRLGERSVVERRCRRLVADDPQHLAVVLAAVGHRRVGRVRHLQRELAQAAARAPRAAPPRPAARPSRVAASAALRSRVLGRRLPDLLRHGRSGAARSSSTALCSARFSSSSAEHLVEEAGADALALDAGAVLGVVAETTEVDHSPNELTRGAPARAGRRSMRSRWSTPR